MQAEGGLVNDEVVLIYDLVGRVPGVVIAVADLRRSDIC